MSMSINFCLKKNYNVVLFIIKSEESLHALKKYTG